jgi:hypothetical protein
MRKEDRIRQQEHHSEDQQDTHTPPTTRQQERVKGSAENQQPKHPPHESGKLPLPD